MRTLVGEHTGVNGRPEYVRAAAHMSLKRLNVETIGLALAWTERRMFDSGAMQMMKPDIAAWLTAQCAAVEDIDLSSALPDIMGMAGGAPPNGTPADASGTPPTGVGNAMMQMFAGMMPQPTLYDCAANTR